MYVKEELSIYLMAESPSEISELNLRNQAGWLAPV